MMGKVLALLGALMPLLSLRLWSTLWIHHFSENDLLRLGVEDPICFMEKRLRKACMVWVAMGAYIVVESNVYLLVVMSMGVLVYELPYLQLKNAHKQHLKALRFQFPIWLRQLQILLESNNVSQSLLLSLEGAPSALQVPLASLCKQLEQNPADFTAYLSFLQEEQMHEIERLMKMLYRFQLVGAHDAAFQLHRMVETTAQWLTQERANRQKVRLSTYEWWGMLPLVMVTLVFMIMMFEVMVGMLGKGVGI